MRKKAVAKSPSGGAEPLPPVVATASEGEPLPPAAPAVAGAQAQVAPEAETVVAGAQAQAAPEAGSAVEAPQAAGAGAGVPGYLQDKGFGTDAPDEPAAPTRRRALAFAVAAVAVVLAGVLVVTALAGGGKDDTAAAATPTSATPSAKATPSPSASTPSVSPTPSASPSATPKPTTEPPAPVTTKAEAARNPTKAPAPPAPPAKAPVAGTGVTSVAFTSDLRCRAHDHTATAHVRVTYDPSVSGTVRLEWWRSSTPGAMGAERMSPEQSATFPKGASTYDFTGNFSFKPDPRQPYIGVTVLTTPAAGSGMGVTRVSRSACGGS